MSSTVFQSFFIERITDISNDLCRTIDELKTETVLHNRVMSKVLEDLYLYHRSNENIHPLTNWHAHRIRCMSCIATKLRDVVKIWECHYFVLQYLYERGRCGCHVTVQKHTSNDGVNHDFYHRDSLNYLVYGSQALANACAYLKPITRYDYRWIFRPIIEFLRPYIDGTKVHLEYVHSEIPSDSDKPEFGKPWNPSYADTLLCILHTSLDM